MSKALLSGPCALVCIFFFGCSSPRSTDEDDITIEATDTAEHVQGEDTSTSAPVDDPNAYDVLNDMSDNEAAGLFDRSEVVEVRLTLPEEIWSQLKVDARDEQYTSADVTIMGETFGNVGLRFKGAYGSLYHCFDESDTLICDKLSMKIKFNEYVEEQRFLGLKRLNLHSMRHDTTKMRDVLAYDTFRSMGIITPRATYAFVYVNDKPLGLYGLVEQIDGRFTDSRFVEGDGNLYKEAWPVDTSNGYYQEHLKTNKDIAVHDHFIAFSNDMANADDATLPAVLSQWMNIDYLTRYMAVDFAIANWDGFTSFYCGFDWACVNHNYYIYQEETKPYFWIIPWDLEATFVSDHWFEYLEPWDNLDAACVDIPYEPNQEFYMRPAGCDQTIRAIALADRPRYEQALTELLDVHLSEPVMTAKIEELRELIQPYVDADPDVDVGTWWSETEWQISELNVIRERVATEVAGYTPADVRVEEPKKEIVIVETTTLDDCSDDDISTSIGGDWIAYSDRHDGGESEIWPECIYSGGVFEMSAPGYNGEGYAARFFGTTGSILGWDFIGMFQPLGPNALCPNPQPSTVDFSRYDGIRFKAKGTMDDGEFWVILPYSKTGVEDNCNNGVAADTLTKWGNYYVNVASKITEDWSEIVVGFDAFRQPSWIMSEAEYVFPIETVLANLQSISWQYTNPKGGSADIWIDDIELYRTADHSVDDEGLLDAGIGSGDSGTDSGGDGGE